MHYRNGVSGQPPIVYPSLKHHDRGAEMIIPPSPWLCVGLNRGLGRILSDQALLTVTSLRPDLLPARLYDPRISRLL